MCTDVFTLVSSRLTVSGLPHDAVTAAPPARRLRSCSARWLRSCSVAPQCAQATRLLRPPPGLARAGERRGRLVRRGSGRECVRVPSVCVRARACRVGAGGADRCAARALLPVRAGALTPREGGRQCAPARTRERARGPAPPLRARNRGPRVARAHPAATSAWRPALAPSL